MPQPILILLDYIQKIILDLDSGIKKRSLRKTKVAYEKLIELSNYLKELLPEDFIEENFKDFDRHMHYIDVFLRKKNFEWISSNFYFRISRARAYKIHLVLKIKVSFQFLKLCLFSWILRSRLVMNLIFQFEDSRNSY